MKKRKGIITSLVLACSMLVVGCTGTSGPDLNRGSGSSLELLEVHFIDVGQADSILIQTPNGINALIDAGNNNDDELVIDYLKDQGVKRVDFLIGTHPHEDHIGGMDKVIEAFEIGEVYMPKVGHTTKTFKDVVEAMKAKNLTANVAKAGVEIDLGSGIEAEFVAPNSDKYEDLNDYSATLKLEYGDTAFLFTGDAEKHSEEEMIKKYGKQLKADVLKLGHHGSRTSSTEEFLNVVDPELAIITCGKDNDYGHPHKETIEKLEKHDIPYLRADQEGHIVLSSDGTIINVGNERIASDKKDDNSETKPTKEQAAGTIAIDNIDPVKEIVVINNTGNQAVDLSGYRLLSVSGEQEFIFPAGTIVKENGTISVVSGPKAQEGSGKLFWTKENIWNNNGDPGKLYDAKGAIVSSFE